MDPVYAVQGALQMRGLTDAPGLPDLPGRPDNGHRPDCGCNCHRHETPLEEFDYGKPFPEELR